MKTTNIREAKKRLSRLVPIEDARKPVKIGGLNGSVPDNFNTMFEEEIAAQFAGAPPTAAGRKRK